MTKGRELAVTWDTPLILLSVLIAIIGSLTALAQAHRMRMSSGYTARVWMITGGITLGMAIWSMHFIGMFAYHLPIPIRYDVPLTVLSVLPGIAASMLCFFVLSEPDISVRRIIVGSLLMGAGISAMHYTGMASIRMSPPINYNPLIFTASILIAILASMGALLMMYRGKQRKMPALSRFVLGGTVMGLAISSMHYTAMWGTHIKPGSICLAVDSGLGKDIPLLIVAMISLIWFSGGILVALFDERIAGNKAESMGQLEQVHLDLRKRTAELADQEEMLRSITETAQDAVIMVDRFSLVTYWNAAAERIFGYAKSEIIGKNLHDLIVPERDRASAHEGFSRFAHSGTGPLIGETRQIQAMRKSSEEFPAEVSLSAVMLRGQFNAVGIVRDVTKRVQIEERLKQLATTDTLTGIYNRRYFDEALESEINRSARFSTPFTLIMFDIDHFKRINDTFGHQSGDLVLVQLAQVVRRAIRTTDLFARWGGEEFIILCPNCDLEAGRLLAEKLRMLIKQQQFADAGHVTCSFGVACHAHGDGMDSMLKKVDRCLYHAKASGRNRVETVATVPRLDAG